MTITNNEAMIIAAAIGAIPAIGAILMTWMVSNKVTEVHLAINGRMTAWLKAAEETARAKGVADVLHAQEVAKTADEKARASGAADLLRAQELAKNPQK